ncbi:RNA-guided endonuclease TnpB family protein [Streptomyces sp. GS7]|uniref:RNA-guided endonuclease TnpB family protein n=1 Tax=Streptomyces sp. GS7 TaxID=2692234 RepID=UPI003FA7EF70
MTLRARRRTAAVHRRARTGDRYAEAGLERATPAIRPVSVRNMVKNRSLARAISDAAWSDFRSMLEYKAAWYGREVIAVDRFFPSSRLCSHFGALQERMPLQVRTWRCGCGATRDRDVNAARNVLAAGLAVTATSVRTLAVAPAGAQEGQLDFQCAELDVSPPGVRAPRPAGNAPLRRRAGPRHRLSQDAEIPCLKP